MMAWIHLAGSVAVFAAVLLIGRIAWAKFAGYDAEHQLTEADNPAVGVVLFGCLGGLICVLAALMATDAAAIDDPTAMGWDLIEMALYGLLAVPLLLISERVNDRAILYAFSIKKELVDDRNSGTGAVVASTYLASGIVLAAAFGGHIDPSLVADYDGTLAIIGHELGVAVVLFVLSQVALIVYGVVYRRFLGFDLHAAIADDYVKDGVKHGGNLAAGLAFGGHLVAFAIVLWGAGRQDFFGWADYLTDFGIAAAVGLVVLPLWRVFVDRIMLPKADLAKEIYTDRNVNAALLEAAAVIGLAVAIALAL